MDGSAAPAADLPPDGGKTCRPRWLRWAWAGRVHDVSVSIVLARQGRLAGASPRRRTSSCLRAASLLSASGWRARRSGGGVVSVAWLAGESRRSEYRGSRPRGRPLRSVSPRLASIPSAREQPVPLRGPVLHPGGRCLRRTFAISGAAGPPCPEGRSTGRTRRWRSLPAVVEKRRVAGGRAAVRGRASRARSAGRVSWPDSGGGLTHPAGAWRASRPGTGPGRGCPGGPRRIRGEVDHAQGRRPARRGGASGRAGRVDGPGARRVESNPWPPSSAAPTATAPTATARISGALSPVVLPGIVGLPGTVGETEAVRAAGGRRCPRRAVRPGVPPSSAAAHRSRLTGRGRFDVPLPGSRSAHVAGMV